MAKLHPTLCALAVLSVGTALAQETAPLSSTPNPAAAIAPAAIEPPVAVTGEVAQIAPPAAVPDAAPIPGVDPALTPVAPAPNGNRLNDFQGDPIDLVLRTLARQAGMNIVVSDQVATTAGTVNMRIADKSPKQAIEIIVESKGLIMDEGKGGVYYIKTTAEKAKEPTESASYTLSYAQSKDILPLLTTQLQSAVPPQFDQRTNTVFYRENRSNMEKIALFLQTIDTPTQQVMIEARLVEVTANPKQSYGINWGGVLGGSSNAQTISLAGSNVAGSIVNGLTGTSAGTGTTTSAGTPITSGSGTTTTSGSALNTTGATNSSNFTNSLASTGNFLRDASSFSSLGSALAGQFAILNVPQLSVTLRMLNEDADAEFLANPRVVTANNTEAEIKITTLRPIPQLNFNEQTAQAVFSGFADKEFGNTLKVTPSINKDDFVSLVVKPEISTSPGDVNFQFGGAVVSSPIIDKRTLNSNVLIRSGDTLAIGGLLQDEIRKGRAKVPILGDIPILGYAFQEKTSQRLKRNLLIFVTPTVIKQGYGTGLEDQVSGLNHSGEEFADPNGWRNNAKGAKRLVPTSHRSVAADYPKPGMAPAPVKLRTTRTVITRGK
ncbi:MAG: Type and secretion system protein [Chthoniobacter sp.]|nr:Type and secretion system protein [Chthoniobacter sp.]